MKKHARYTIKNKQEQVSNLIFTYSRRRNEIEVEKDGTVFFLSWKNMKLLYGFYWSETLIDSYSYTTAICKLFPDVVCLSNSCSKKVNAFL